MRIVLGMLALLALLVNPAFGYGAEITDVLDAADDNDPLDLNIDVHFHSTLERAKITRELSGGSGWTNSSNPDTTRPDYNALHYHNQIYSMDYMIEFGLFDDFELYVNVPWIIKDTRRIRLVADYGSDPKRLYNGLFSDSEIASRFSPRTERSGLGDMTIGVKWAPFNGEHDDTTSTWVIGLDYIIPSGELANPNDIIGGKTGHVGLGHHQLVPYLLFSHRFKVLDPYCGIHLTIPMQGSEAKASGFHIPYHGGFLIGMEIVPWENTGKHLKFAIDIRLHGEFFAAVQSRGSAISRGTVNELSDFLYAHTSDEFNPFDAGGRQLQTTSAYAQFGLHLGFVLKVATFAQLRVGASLSHNTEHFLTGAKGAIETNPDAPDYYNTGSRFRVEETTLFTYWVNGTILF
jgi:hypothetical protein